MVRKSAESSRNSRCMPILRSLACPSLMTRSSDKQALFAIPPHSNIMPLYDSFLLPRLRNFTLCLYQWRGIYINLSNLAPVFAFCQWSLRLDFPSEIVQGLHHIHASGYFHSLRHEARKYSCDNHRASLISQLVSTHPYLAPHPSKTLRS